MIPAAGEAKYVKTIVKVNDKVRIFRIIYRRYEKKNILKIVEKVRTSLDGFLLSRVTTYTRTPYPAKYVKPVEPCSHVGCSALADGEVAMPGCGVLPWCPNHIDMVLLIKKKIIERMGIRSLTDRIAFRVAMVKSRLEYQAMVNVPEVQRVNFNIAADIMTLLKYDVNEMKSLLMMKKKSTNGYHQ